MVSLLEHPPKTRQTAKMEHATFCIPSPFFYTELGCKQGRLGARNEQVARTNRRYGDFRDTGHDRGAACVASRREVVCRADPRAPLQDLYGHKAWLRKSDGRQPVSCRPVERI